MKIIYFLFIIILFSPLNILSYEKFIMDAENEEFLKYLETFKDKTVYNLLNDFNLKGFQYKSKGYFTEPPYYLCGCCFDYDNDISISIIIHKPKYIKKVYNKKKDWKFSEFLKESISNIEVNQVKIDSNNNKKKKFIVTVPRHLIEPDQYNTQQIMNCIDDPLYLKKYCRDSLITDNFKNIKKNEAFFDKYVDFIKNNIQSGWKVTENKLYDINENSFNKLHKIIIENPLNKKGIIYLIKFKDNHWLIDDIILNE